MNASLLERIQKILAKTTEAGCTEAEAATAFALASKIMAEHGLEMAQVLAHDPDAMQFGTMSVKECHRRDFTVEIAVLIVERYFGVKSTLLHSNDGSRHYVLFGAREATEAAAHVFTRIVATANDGWTRFRTRTRCPASKRKSYLTGFLIGVEAKVRSTRDGMTNGEHNALAIVNGKLESEFEKSFGQPKTTSTKPLAPAISETDPLAFSSGAIDGQAAAIHREIR